MVVRKARRAIPFAFIALGGAVFWLFLGRAPIEEGRCRLIHKKADLHHLVRLDNQLLRLASQSLEPESSRPDDIKDLPNGFQQPWCYHLDTKGGRLPLVLDISHTPRLCVDLNRDGLLAREPCFRAQSLPSDRWGRRPWRFGPVFLCGKSAGQEAEAFDAIYYVADRPGPLSVYPASYRFGRLRIDGTTYRVALMDGDFDGRFASCLSLPMAQGTFANLPPENIRLPRGCDLFAIDRNGDGKFEFSWADRSEIMPLSKIVLLGDRYYAIEAAPDGSELHFTPSEPAFGRLAVDPPSTKLQLKLWSDTADQYVSRSAGPWDLPVGTYQTVSAFVILEDLKGDAWTFEALRDVGRLSSFEIRPQETTQVRLGPPFIVKMDVRRADARTISICPIVVGCGGEQYRADFRHNWRRPPERTFKIVDEQGNVLVTDKFQFG